MSIALVVGCAACVWEDVAQAESLAKYDAIYCVKLAGVYWPDKFDVWVTLHPEFMDAYEAKRRAKRYPGGYEIVGPLDTEHAVEHRGKGRIARRTSFRWPGMNSSASSGIFAVKVAVEDGHNVVLAGVPMDKSEHFSRGKKWKQVDQFQSGLIAAVPHMRGKVKSVSGQTRDLLGAPTAEWIAQAGQ